MHTTSLFSNESGLSNDQCTGNACALFIVRLLEREDGYMGLRSRPESSAGSKDNPMLELTYANLDRSEESCRGDGTHGLCWEGMNEVGRFC